MYVFKFKERVFFWNILILAWICCLFPKFKSRLPLEIKNFDFPFLDSCLKSRKLEKYSWFLTAEILELLKILDSCLNQDLKVLDSWFLSRPLKIHLALLCNVLLIFDWKEKIRPLFSFNFKSWRKKASLFFHFKLTWVRYGHFLDF